MGSDGRRKNGGATVDFGASDVVTCNGVAMQREEGKMDGVYYTGTIQSGTEKIEFTWTDKEGKKYTNSAKIYPFELDENSFSRTENGGWKITWKGIPVQELDKVVVQLKYKRNKKDHTVTETATEEGVNYIIFSQEEISDLEGQSVTVSAWREEFLKLENVTKGEGTIKVHGDGGSFNYSLLDRIL